MDELPATEGFRDFAARVGCRPGYVTELRRAGRLVLTENGRRVRVADSLQLIASTRDPSKAGVRARHASARSHSAAQPASGQPSVAKEPDPHDPGTVVFPSDPLSLRRAKAQAEREEAMARKALRDEQVEMGGLMVSDQVLAVVTDVTVQLRSRLELLPAVLAPQLAATDDEDAVRLMLRDGIEQALEELARKFASLSRAEA